MKILDLAEKDWEAVRAIHAKAEYDFEIPDLGNPLVVIKKKLVDERGRIAAASFARLLLNGFLVLDKEWRTPAERLEAVEMMNEAMMQEAIKLGQDEAIVQVDRRFSGRLLKMGWKPGKGLTLTKELSW